jgi:hypothetical protein
MAIQYTVGEWEQVTSGWMWICTQEPHKFKTAMASMALVTRSEDGTVLGGAGACEECWGAELREPLDNQREAVAARTPSAAVPAYLRKPTGNFRADEAIKRFQVTMNDLTKSKSFVDTLEKFKRDLEAAVNIPAIKLWPRSASTVPPSDKGQTPSDEYGAIASAFVPDAVAGCRLCCACKVHRPAKPEPYVPAIDDFDLLPDA